MSTLYFDDNPLTPRGSLQYVPPGFLKCAPEITYNFSKPVRSGPARAKRALRAQAQDYLKASGSYILMLLLRAVSCGLRLLDKYTLGIYASEFSFSSGDDRDGALHGNYGPFDGANRDLIDPRKGSFGPENGLLDLIKGSSDLSKESLPLSNESSAGRKLEFSSSFSRENTATSAAPFNHDLVLFEAISSSTPRVLLPLQSHVLPERRNSSNRRTLDLFSSIFELDDTDDDPGNQYGTSFKHTAGSRLASHGRVYSRREEKNDVSAVDILRTELASPRDDYDAMISRFYKPFTQAPRPHYSLTNAMLAYKPASDFSLIMKDKRGQIQLLVSRERAETASAVKPLTADQLLQVNQYWGMRLSNTLVVSAFTIDISVRDFQTLCDSSWLNDNVIDFYLNLVSESLEGTFCWTTHFFSTLRAKGYQGVARWAKRKKVNLAEKKKVIVPINIMSTHWALAVVDNTAHTICYYDSLSSGGNRKTVEILQDYMNKERDRLQAPAMDYVLHASMKTPQQQNGYDCGVFTCTAARYVAGGRPLTFSQKDMKVIRRRMAYEILKKSLIDEAASLPHL